MTVEDAVATVEGQPCQKCRRGVHGGPIYDQTNNLLAWPCGTCHYILTTVPADAFPLAPASPSSPTDG